MSEESERVKYLLKYWSHLQLAREYEQLENIIKEVREYIETQMPIVKAEIGIANINTSTSELLNYEKILQILDKENK